MQGFLDGLPILVKVVWATSEVSMLSGKPLPEGLLAETATPNVAGGVTRWLVPWEAISYIKQDVPPPPVSQPAQVIPAGTPTVEVPPDRGESAGRSQGR